MSEPAIPEQGPNTPADRDIAKMFERGLQVPLLQPQAQASLTPVRRRFYDPIEIDEQTGQPVLQPVLRQRIVRELASPKCSALRGFQLQRIYMKQPGWGLRGWARVLVEAEIQAKELAPEYCFVAERVESDGEWYAVVWKESRSSAEREYVCTVYRPSSDPNDPTALKIASEIAEALNYVHGVPVTQSQQ